jgi:hypothetical protein
MKNYLPHESRNQLSKKKTVSCSDLLMMLTTPSFWGAKGSQGRISRPARGGGRDKSHARKKT